MTWDIIDEAKQELHELIENWVIKFMSRVEFNNSDDEIKLSKFIASVFDHLSCRSSNSFGFTLNASRYGIVIKMYCLLDSLWLDSILQDLKLGQSNRLHVQALREKHTASVGNYGEEWIGVGRRQKLLTLSSLPPEILLEIFSNLRFTYTRMEISSLLTLSRYLFPIVQIALDMCTSAFDARKAYRWLSHSRAQHLSSVRDNLKSIRFRSYCHHGSGSGIIETFYFGHVLLFCPNVENVELTTHDVPFWTCSLVKQGLLAARNLRSFALTSYSIGWDSAEALFNSLEWTQALSSLSLDIRSRKINTVTALLASEVSLSWLLKLRNLRFLYIVHNWDFALNFLKLLERIPDLNLSSLALGIPYNSKPGPDIIKMLLSRCQHLETFELRSSGSFGHIEDTLSIVLSMSTSFNLRRLDLPSFHLPEFFPPTLEEFHFAADRMTMERCQKTAYQPIKNTIGQLMDLIERQRSRKLRIIRLKRSDLWTCAGFNEAFSSMADTQLKEIRSHHDGNSLAEWGRR
ncbi:hypothetical protein BT69DRAFT_1292511 [Atractiella rhizophila]|nr:hypothetical protein BT69DRAFT_1292511 [Atractiella rhizophila]